jgi:hypothetical protein
MKIDLMRADQSDGGLAKAGGGRGGIRKDIRPSAVTQDMNDQKGWGVVLGNANEFHDGAKKHRVRKQTISFLTSLRVLRDSVVNSLSLHGVS